MTVPCMSFVKGYEIDYVKFSMLTDTLSPGTLNRHGYEYIALVHSNEPNNVRSILIFVFVIIGGTFLPNANHLFAISLEVALS